ncbi:uncharacterized protein LOC124316144 isoform X2 [Daphnia pulicaria]|uniref:uncharacterized protein LOC124316144 isoform X2 n=1 Tax=Daphnia pulicaria TaxID=35523 RepID=UPI001EEC7A13|nr:uncharacterized protein LOC124316144 isoform X2 [Daphnia pulicaria]
MKLHLILVSFFIAFVKSAESQQPENNDPTCSTLEAAFWTIVTALSNQNNDLFAPVKEILAQDVAISSILSRTPIRPDPTASATNSTATKNAPEITIQITKGDSESLLQQGKVLVDNLKSLVKCSLAQFVDISTIDSESNVGSNSSAIAASFSTKNESLEIVWPVLSAECLKFSSGVWIRVYQISNELAKSLVETSLSVPQKCLKKNSKTTFSIALSPPSSITSKKDPCLFLLARNLTQCRSYAVEVIPNFQTLRGKTLRTEIVIPPKLSGDFSTKSLMDIVVNSNSLKLNWKDNSGCASQMTSLNLKVLQDGLASSERTNNTYRIPRSCLKQDRNEVNAFSMMLPTNPQTCSIEWKPLDKCRKYTFDMSSQYTATWNGSSILLDIFTKGNEADFTIFPNDGSNPWRCPRKYFSCSWNCNHAEASFVCNGVNDCRNGRDEQYCDQSVCKEGFKCGRQCIPKELVCNGQHDCLDGSDENYSCIYANMCQHLTDSSGNFSSQRVPKPADDIHSERAFDATLKTTVLISVQPNQQIWLTLKKCVTLEQRHFVNIYDGPYSTSPLLLSTSGLVTNPFSVRSSFNELYVEFPSYYQTDYGISAFYTSVNSTNEPFVPGCGGYIYGDGVIAIPNYVASNTDISDCFWFIEATTNEDTILLTNTKSASSFQANVPTVRNYYYMDGNYSTTTESYYYKTTPNYVDYYSNPASLLSSPENLSSIIVYDGWSTSGHVLHDRKDSMTNIAMYSISNKMLVHFKPPSVVKENVAFSWRVLKISTPECKHDLNGANGIIKSPNYPVQVYPDLTDCRWNITVKAGSKVRLLFAYFETQAEMDFLYVYDGPSVYSELLFEKSGLITTPFEVNSTTNQVLVRFTSDGTSDASYPGFLAVYSTV